MYISHMCICLCTETTMPSQYIFALRDMSNGKVQINSKFYSQPYVLNQSPLNDYSYCLMKQYFKI